MEEIVIVGRHAVKEAIVSGHTINKILIQKRPNQRNFKISE